jgi:hypothetical protein
MVCTQTSLCSYVHYVCLSPPVLLADGPGQYGAAICKQNNQVHSAHPITLQEQFTLLCKFEAFMAGTDQAAAFWF